MHRRESGRHYDILWANQLEPFIVSDARHPTNQRIHAKAIEYRVYRRSAREIQLSIYGSMNNGQNLPSYLTRLSVILVANPQ